MEKYDDGLPESGLVREREIRRPHGPLPISRSQFWQMVKDGRLTPVKISPRVTCFWVDEVRALMRPRNEGGAS